jgi:SAM-dependent methyltransferase
MTGSSDHQRLDETRAFFGPRAAGWNDRFAEDGPAFARAIGELDIRRGATVVDVGCGAGRALPDLEAAVGPDGLVVGVDVTPEMLVEARRHLPSPSPTVLADAAWLPLPRGACDVIFAAGLLSHLADPVLGLVEFARVAADDGRLALFHPVGRAALAGKHGRELRADDPLDPAHLPSLLAASGWHADYIDDGPQRYLATATHRL